MMMRAGKCDVTGDVTERALVINESSTSHHASSRDCQRPTLISSDRHVVREGSNETKENLPLF